ncbi:cobyric acid synthase [Mycetocola lacteus]|uniref:Lipid II isoglutaminyl synthase (glutamine-hydrolyzing) subunit GatD n=1 Tax=Mycetocola lacteus TaxID=76637 RepID=A0A3L7AP49_9MICO|nr:MULTISPECIES: cobyric acid synthase [Mycetocola]MCS4276124.1 CobQ-like glutamine amidotransferase family enzyme [Mycetocola sp. BIGb0189]RLP82127.1 cobyric acid synthase [Mycetocola lacteus]
MTVSILELFSNDLALNGDTGNRRALAHRLELAGIEVEQRTYNPGDTLGILPDIVVVGTGSSSAQRALAPEFAQIAEQLREWAKAGVVFLAAGAGFHLLGKTIKLDSNTVIEGAGVFDVTVDATAARIVTEAFGIDGQFGLLIGTENHSAVTTLAQGMAPIGAVRNGFGNGDGLEGAVVGNAYGTHLHGPALVLNPVFADHLISLAVARTGDTYIKNDKHDELDQTIDLAREILIGKLPR